MELYPILLQHGDVDILISGIQADLDFPYPVRYRLYGLSFIFGRHGGIAIWDTVKKLKLIRLIRDILSLPVRSYDLVINDFEPVSAWACKLRKAPCISLSHQAAVLAPEAPKPASGGWGGRLILRHYAPASAAYGFHFQAFAGNIYTPVIRRDVRHVRPTDEGHYTVYLPAYDDATIIRHLSCFKDVSWQVFSKHNKNPFRSGHVQVFPVTKNAFYRSMVSARGILCGAGFETPAEALHIGKKLMVIPMQRQYEQQCNAAALARMGVPVIRQLSKKYHNEIRTWIDNDRTISIYYPDHTERIISRIIHGHAPQAPGIPRDEATALPQH